MADITDPQRYGDGLTNEIERLDEAPVSEGDRRAIQQMITYADSVEDLATSTIEIHASSARKTAERADKPLVEMDADDLEGLWFALRHDHDLSKGTVRNVKKALTKLYRVLDEDDLADSFDVGSSKAHEVEVDETDLLTDDEVDAFLDAAPTARDKAQIAVLLDVGLRIGALASLRVGDLSFTEDAALITINSEAHTKGARGTVPVTWSRGHLANWLEVHPAGDDPSAALFCPLPTATNVDPSDDALTTDTLRRRLKRVARLADIDPERANPHRFRKTAISQWVRDRLSEQEIKHRAGWTKDSQQMRVYAPITDEEFNDQILSHYDLAETDASGPSLSTCPMCGTSLRERTRFCPSCGSALDPVAAEVADDATDALLDDLTDADLDDDAQAVARAVLDTIRADSSTIADAVED